MQGSQCFTNDHISDPEYWGLPFTFEPYII